MTKKITKPMQGKKIGKPLVGHCPLCFTKYKMEMRPKEGLEATKKFDELNSRDFTFNFSDVYTKLVDRSQMRMSVCNDCFGKLDDESAEKAFAQTRLLDVDDAEKSRLPKDVKEKAIAMVESREMLVWGKSEKEMNDKYDELLAAK